MSDYYSHRDQARQEHRHGYPDYATEGSGGTWLWAAIALVALVALIGAGMSGGGGNTPAEGAVIEAAPAPADPAATPVVPAN